MNKHASPSRATDPRLEPVMNVDEINAFIDRVYPELARNGDNYYASAVTADGAIVRLDADHRHVRPGGTISGPTLFNLADMAGYVCVVSRTGPEALSVTTTLTINFMRKALPGPIEAHGRILKLGKSLMVFDAAIMSAGEMVAHATGTYSIPPRRTTSSSG